MSTLRYGICMEGNEEAFQRALLRGLEVAQQRPTPCGCSPECDSTWPYRMIEIGTASGQTTRGMADYVASYDRNHRIVTFDIPGGWSLDPHAVELLAKAYPQIEAVVRPGGGRAALDDPSWRGPIHFAFIDGCHGAPCAREDFLAVERHTVPGSVVVFHDTSKSCQGIHLQPHCQTGIDVRRALTDLGLLTNTYPGWQLVEETHTPHGIAVFQRN